MLNYDETLALLFINGPTWDGNLISKAERDAAVEDGLIFRYNGWQSLTEKGLEYVLHIDFKHWYDQRMYKKLNYK